MRAIDAQKEFDRLDHENQAVFTLGDLREIFPNEVEKTLSESLRRLVRRGILERAANGLYFNPRSNRSWMNILEELACVLRRGRLNYLRLECALSEWGVIAQIPQEYLTVMTTGRRGFFRTPFGRIEFTHTSRDEHSIRKSVVDVGRPLPLATVWTALRDMRRVGRNLHLVSMVDYERVLAETDT